MTQQGTEKDGDLDIGDVLVGMQVQIESDAAALGTDGDGRNRRDLIPLVAVPDDRRVAPGRPRPPDVGDQQESAFVGEGQVGLQVLRVFLSRSSDIVSSARWPPHRAPARAGLLA
jgi:hypothetical protein